MAKNQQTSIAINVKRIEDLPKVIDQIHTFTKRLSAGSGVTITVVAPEVTPASTEKEESELL